MKKRWTIDTAKACIQRNKGRVGQGQIRAINPGLKVLGAIDFLVNFHKYTWMR